MNGGTRNIDACLYVRPSDRTTLERLVADGKTAQKIVARARIVLLSGRGFGTNSIQREARVSKPTVGRWQKAYMDGGVERLLKDRARGARAGKKPISAEVRLAIVKRTAQEKPKHANALERTYVGREHGLKPHLTREFAARCGLASGRFARARKSGSVVRRSDGNSLCIFPVLRRFKWIETRLPRGGDHVDHGREGCDVAISASTRPGGLEQAVDGRPAATAA